MPSTHDYFTQPLPADQAKSGKGECFSLPASGGSTDAADPATSAQASQEDREASSQEQPRPALAGNQGQRKDDAANHYQGNGPAPAGAREDAIRRRPLFGQQQAQRDGEYEEDDRRRRP